VQNEHPADLRKNFRKKRPRLITVQRMEVHGKSGEKLERKTRLKERYCPRNQKRTFWGRRPFTTPLEKRQKKLSGARNR